MSHAPVRSLVIAPLVAAMLVATILVAPGAAQSPPGSAGAKAAAKCQQAITKANAKFLSQRLKRLAACSNAVLSCVQTLPGAPECIVKATGKCRKQLGAPELPDKLADAAEGAILKACESLPLADVFGDGLGFAKAESVCAGVGITPFATVADLATCLQLVHAKLSEQAFGAELPRAAELTAQGGIAATIVPDLPVYGGCGNCATPPTSTGKSLAGCAAAIAKASSGYLAKARGALDKCANAFIGCAQLKPGDQGCLDKAKATCLKIPTELGKQRAKVGSTLQGKCGGVLAFANLQAPSGLGLQSLLCECDRVGINPVGSLADYAECLTRQHECALTDALPTIVPALDGLLAGQGIAVGDLLCAPPTATNALALEGARLPIPFGKIGKFVSGVSGSIFKNFRAPLSPRGSKPRVRRLGGVCGPAPGRTCHFRLPITKSVGNLQRVAATPATLIVAVRRLDGEFSDDHFEIDIPDVSSDTEKEFDVFYPNDLSSCQFELAFAVQEGDDVSAYTPIEQVPHAIPGNDECLAATPITTAMFSDVVDMTAASLASVELGFSTCALPPAISKSVFYTFTAPSTGFITADTFGSDFDSVLNVYDDDCFEPIRQACTDDSDGTLQSQVGRVVVGGQTYRIQVGHRGDPTAEATLHFNFRFETLGAGSPPKLSKGEQKVLQLNTCDLQDGGPLGSFFQYDFDFADPDGDVVSGTSTAHVTAEFQPSGTPVSFDLIPGQFVITGDGFGGRISVILCTRFGNNPSVDTKISIVDVSGEQSNAISFTTNQPSGAN